MLQGIDVSGWQAGINLAAIDCDFVIMKATGGVSYVSTDCDRQFQQAKSLGRLRGVYHFANDDQKGSSAVAEADFFVDNTLGYHDGETILVLDWESHALPLGVGWAKAWLDRVYARTGIKPMIYMSVSVTFSYDWSSVVAADYGLWVAAYGTNPVTGFREVSPPTVGAWPFVAIYQYGSKGRVGGYGSDLDVNAAFMDRAGWLAYAAVNGAPVEVPTTPAPAPTPAPSGTHTVQAGETLSGIAARYGTTWQALQAANGIADANLIFPGQTLRISGGGTSGRTHVIQPGENLSGIAAKYGTTWQALAALNNISNPDLIFAGNTLRIP